MGSVSRAVVVSGVRTPIGRYGGALAGERPDDLAALVIAEAVARSRVDANEIEDVYFGCANQAGEDNRNVARMAALLAGLPQSVAGVTVNRLCASGLTAVAAACHAVMAGDGDLFVAGGVESMTRAPYAFAKADKAYPRGNLTVYDPNGSQLSSTAALIRQSGSSWPRSATRLPTSRSTPTPMSRPRGASIFTPTTPSRRGSAGSPSSRGTCRWTPEP